MKRNNTKKKKTVVYPIFIAFFLSLCLFYLISFDYGSAWDLFSGRNNSNKNNRIFQAVKVKGEYWNLFLLASPASREGNWYFRLDSDGDEIPDYWETMYGLSGKAENGNNDFDKDGLSDLHEYQFGTNPSRKDMDGDRYNDLEEISKGYDPAKPGGARLDAIIEIAKIGVNAPIIWTNTEDEEVILDDLRRGVSHYHRSAAPGQKGNMIITGHSSNYVWERGEFNHVFRRLNALEVGDRINIYIRIKEENGLKFSYEVEKKYVTVPDDQSIFAEPKYPLLTLITCWPLGTDFRRLIVKAELKNQAKFVSH